MRDDWTNLVPQTSVMKGAVGFDRITVHHTGDTVKSFADENSVRFALQNILTDHCNRNFGDIGYHFVIDPEGKVWQARSMAYDGAHVSGQNSSNVGVMILGNFESNQPSDGQISTMILMVNAMCERFGIKKHRVFGHRDIGASLCPGRNLYEEVLKFKSIKEDVIKEMVRK
jgi:N-acetyl-anhydromuramyl-L-alanine amidase AmpD